MSFLSGHAPFAEALETKTSFLKTVVLFAASGDRFPSQTKPSELLIAQIVSL